MIGCGLEKNYLAVSKDKMTPQRILKIEHVEQRRRNDLRREYNNHVLQGGDFEANFREDLSKVKSLTKLNKMMKNLKKKMKALQAEEKRVNKKLKAMKAEEKKLNESKKRIVKQHEKYKFAGEAIQQKLNEPNFLNKKREKERKLREFEESNVKKIEEENYEFIYGHPKRKSKRKRTNYMPGGVIRQLSHDTAEKIGEEYSDDRIVAWNEE